MTIREFLIQRDWRGRVSYAEAGAAFVALLVIAPFWVLGWIVVKCIQAFDAARRKP